MNAAKKWEWLLIGMFLTGCQVQVLTAQKHPGANRDARPNILYIMSDDHTSQALGVYGSRLAVLDPTPHLDQIAREGMIFDNCFVTNSLCTPSRASVVTGQYSQSHGVLELDQGLPISRHYLPQQLKQAGYQTAIIGKWHLKAEPRDFDYYCVLPGQGKYFNPGFQVRGSKPWPNNLITREGHSTDVITDITIDWLKNGRDNKKPFFLMHHYKAPHDMFEFAPRYADYLSDVFIPEPASLYYNANNGSPGTRGHGDSLVGIIGASVSHRDSLWGLGRRLGIPSGIPDPEYAHLVYQEYLKRYLRCVKGIDDNIRRLRDFLEKEGLLENTVIIYTGDQGFMLGEHDYMDKRWMYEESMRMPFFVRYPRSVPKGIRTDAIINNTDFAPTIIDIAGGIIPDQMQGHSFKAILESGKEPEGWQQYTYYRYWMHMGHQLGIPGHFGIRSKRYKLIFFYGRYWIDSEEEYRRIFNRTSWDRNYALQTPAAWEFYDLQQDPGEMNNLYGNAAHRQVILEMKEVLKKKREDLKETDKNFPHIQRVIDRHWND